MTRQYSFNLSYGTPDNHSGVSSGGYDNADKCAFELGVMLKYYSDKGYAIIATLFSDYCATCGGIGKVTKCHSRVKFHSHKPTCYKRCPDCHGKQSDVVQSSLPCGAYAGINAQTKELSDQCHVAEWAAYLALPPIGGAKVCQ